MNPFKLLASLFRFRTTRRQRQIFAYWDGSCECTCDPIATLLAIQSHPQYDYTLHPKLVDEGDMEAISITCAAVREAFGIRAYDAASGTGLTVGETLELLAQFCVFLESLKKSTGPTPTSPSPMESMSSNSVDLTTSDTLDSGSIATGQNSDTPTEFATP